MRDTNHDTPPRRPWLSIILGLLLAGAGASLAAVEGGDGGEALVDATAQAAEEAESRSERVIASAEGEAAEAETAVESRSERVIAGERQQAQERRQAMDQYGDDEYAYREQPDQYGDDEYAYREPETADSEDFGALEEAEGWFEQDQDQADVGEEQVQSWAWDEQAGWTEDEDTGLAAEDEGWFGQEDESGLAQEDQDDWWFDAPQGSDETGSEPLAFGDEGEAGGEQGFWDW